MVKLLHLADVHLDTAFEGRSGALRDHLREALRTAFRRAVKCALDEHVDAVLIAGDLFDDERLSFATEKFLVEQVSRLDRAGIDCVYATGNHDPSGEGFRASSIAWPERFHYVGSREPTLIVLSDAQENEKARVIAAGHEFPQERENLAATFPPAEGAVPHIGVLHTQITSAAGVDRHERYAPCSVDDLRTPGYDYWALGHVHVRQEVDETANAWYAGNLQGRNPRETGPKGGLLVTLDEHGPAEVETRTFAPIRWEHLHLDQLADVKNVQALERQVQSAYRKLAENDHVTHDWLLRVTLAGMCPIADQLRDAGQIADLEDVLADGLAVRDVEVRPEHLTPPVDPEEHRDDVHLLSEVLALIDRAHDDPSILDEIAPDPLAGKPDGIHGDVGARRAYLQELMTGLDREAVMRLLERNT